MIGLPLLLRGPPYAGRRVGARARAPGAAGVGGVGDRCVRVGGAVDTLRSGVTRDESAAKQAAIELWCATAAEYAALVAARAGLKELRSSYAGLVGQVNAAKGDIDAILAEGLDAVSEARSPGTDSPAERLVRAKALYRERHAAAAALRTERDYVEAQCATLEKVAAAAFEASWRQQRPAGEAEEK